LKKKPYEKSGVKYADEVAFCWSWGVIQMHVYGVFVMICKLLTYLLTCLQAKSFHGELQDMLQNLGEIDAQLLTAQPVGGLPETAKKQLDEFNVSVLFIFSGHSKAVNYFKNASFVNYCGIFSKQL
jgi:hypothetical protein